MSDLSDYLSGWFDAERCLAEALSWVPDEHLIGVIRARQDELGIRRKASVISPSLPSQPPCGRWGG